MSATSGIICLSHPPEAAMTAIGNLEVRALSGGDDEWKNQTLTRVWMGTTVARRGELLDVLPLEGFVGLADGLRSGLLTYAVRADELEVVTIHVEREGIGLARALMDAARNVATERRLRRLWLVTTNDNVRAFRFYQRWGMDLVALHRHGVDVVRALKPSIPRVAPNGIPIRHELEFELIL